MAIAGIDLSSHAVDVVLLEDDTDHATWHRFNLTGRTPFERARSLRGCFPTRDWWDDHGVWLLGIEDPHSRFPHVAKALGMATGAVGALLPLSLTAIQTTPNEWMALFTGSARAKKIDILKACAERGFEHYNPLPQDAYDAYGVAWAVRHLNQQALDAA